MRCVLALVLVPIYCTEVEVFCEMRRKKSLHSQLRDMKLDLDFWVR